MRKMTQEEAKAFSKDRCAWKNYKSIDAYIEDIVTILVYSTWHYSEIEARKITEDRMALVKNCYEKKIPADDCACDVGYFGG